MFKRAAYKLAFLALIYVLVAVFSDRVLRCAAVIAGQKVFGAKVEIGKLEADLFPPRLALEKEVDKLTREVQFLQQEAQSDRSALQAELQVDFQRKLNPVLEQVAREKNLHMLVDINNAGAVWVDTGLDLTGEVIKRLDAAKSAAPPAVKK